MANSYTHARSSARRFGGKPEAFQPIHDWFDRTKSAWADHRHRAILHHSYGIFLCEDVFGKAIDNGEGKMIPVRLIAEQHVIEDCGFIPTIDDWLGQLQKQPWMSRGTVPLEQQLASDEPLPPLPVQQVAQRTTRYTLSSDT